MLARLSAWSGGDELRRSELTWLLGAIALGLALRLAYALITRHGVLGVDEADYDQSARLAAEGHWLWFTPPYNQAHPSLWKAPGYPVWTGLIYTVLGPGPTKAIVLQTLLGPLVILMTWLLARRLFGPRAAIVAAALAALYPHMWQWEASLHPEALALPLALGFYLAVLGRDPTPRRAVAAGLLLGVSLLVRPTSLALLALPVAAWWAARGTRRGLGMAAVTAVVAVAVVAPWTVRNAVKYDAFVPISVQDAAISGTFNDDAANDHDNPWSWRVFVRRDRDVIAHKRPDAEFRRVLQDRAFDYIREHPGSVPKAFFWNGLARTWDIWRPSKVLGQARFEGRSRAVEAVALGMYWVLLAFALAGLWRHRDRRDVVAGVLALALASSVLFTIAAATRYRVPLEPLVVIMACSLLAPRAQITGRRARTVP
jgi:4-amino-4-deoxy-L-arabinose transferase-like glycosyltransferase